MSAAPARPLHRTGRWDRVVLAIGMCPAGPCRRLRRARSCSPVADDKVQPALCLNRIDRRNDADFGVQ